MVPRPARTSMCVRSPARDALQRISRKPGSPCASRLYGVAQTVHPCTDRECGVPSPHPCGPCPQSLRCSARLRGTQDQEADQVQSFVLAARASKYVKGFKRPDHSPRMDGLLDNWCRRGAEHRRRGGEKPEGSRRWIAAIAKQCVDALSEQPRPAEKRRGF